MSARRFQEQPFSPERVAEAQADVYLIAFQALSPEARKLVRARIIQVEDLSSDLAIELESWNNAASEALSEFEAMISETQ